MDQKTYVMIKPDAVARGFVGRIVARFEDVGLQARAPRVRHGHDSPGRRQLREHEGKPFYDGLITYITSGPVVKMVLTGPDAVVVARS